MAEPEVHPCTLVREADQPCPTPAVVAVKDRRGTAEWGCEPHAADALDRITGSKLAEVADWDAARRLLALPWNHHSGLEL